MKASGSFCLLLLLALGCVNLDKPKDVAACAKLGICSDQPQTGGASGGETAATGGAGGDSAVIGSGGATSTGGGIGTGGITGSGGIVGSGGTTARDAAAGVDGAGSGGASPVGGAIGTGGASGFGGNSSVGTSGGATGGGVVSSGGVTGSGGDSSAGGATATGGTTAGGGTVGTGGVTGTGGKAGTGGAVVTGGIVATGGSTTVGCGTTKSQYSQTFNFATDLQALSLGIDSTGGSVKYVTTGPSSNPTLCKVGAGCGVLVMPFTSAAAYAAYALAVESFAPSINLVGATVTFSLAVDNPAQVPIQIQAYAQGDATSAYAWTNPATVAGASLLPYAASIGFKDITLTVADYTSTKGKYCAALTGAIGIQLQNTASNAGTVTVYISKITITPPP